MAKKKPDLKQQPAALTEALTFVSPRDGRSYELTMKEKAFCEYYLACGGNGTKAVFEAGYEARNAIVAGAIAYENLRKPQIFEYINMKLEEYGFNDDNVEKQHLFLLNQNADLKSKAKAIDMFYSLRGKYAPKKNLNLNLNSNVGPNVTSKVSKIKQKYEQELRKTFLSDGKKAVKAQK